MYTNIIKEVRLLQNADEQETLDATSDKSSSICIPRTIAQEHGQQSVELVDH